jgi:antitoxin MazE
MQVTITRCGDSLGLCIPQDIASCIGLSEGSRVEVEAHSGRIVISVARQPRYRLEELLAAMAPAAMHESFDWGPDFGSEAIE